MAYSTCTFNPIEDEAVVAALLARANEMAPGSIELVAWPQDVLPALVRHPGLDEWGVADHVERSASSSKESSSSLEDWSDEEEEVRLRWHTTYAAALEAGMYPPPYTHMTCTQLTPQPLRPVCILRLIVCILLLILT